MELMEKVAYLKGLAEGLGLDDSTKEGRVLGVVIDLLDDMALAITDANDSLVAVSEQMESMDEEMSDILEDMYDDDDDDDCDCDYAHVYGRGHHRSHGHSHEYEGELYEVTCPICGDTICVDEDMLDEGEIICPGCGEPLEFDLEGELDCDDNDGDDSEDESKDD